MNGNKKGEKGEVLSDAACLFHPNTVVPSKNQLPCAHLYV